MALRNQNSFENKMAENEQIRNHMSNVLNSVVRQLESGHVDENILDGLQSRLDWLCTAIIRYVDLQIVDERVVNFAREARQCVLNAYQGNRGIHNPNNETLLVELERVFTGERGRPQLKVECEQLEFLLERKFSVAEIASILGISKRTVERRLQEFGLSARAVYARMSDEELDAAILSILRDFPNIGSKRVTGLLRARGMYVQQSRIRASMRRVDPEGTLLRALELNIINRRRYSVAGPLSLWHIDGNHKLIR